MTVIQLNIINISFTLFFIVLNKLREQLNSRGAATIRGMGRAFRIMDGPDGNRKIDANEFFVGLNEFGVNITKAEAQVKFYYIFIFYRH